MRTLTRPHKAHSKGMLHISILTLFPRMFTSPFSQSIIKRAVDKKIITIDYVNIRNFATDNYKSVDGRPYGGGVGMILRVDVVARALQGIQKGHTILLDAGGTPYTQQKAKELSAFEHVILICGHYEGVDERIRSLIDEEISVGDYVLTGGEIPAMVIVDSVARLLPQTLLKSEATIDESFTSGLLEYPQYTRPETYNNKRVPEVLVSGNHKKISEWRAGMAQKRTEVRRPDLFHPKVSLRRK